jgi:hypothetical protein
MATATAPAVTAARRAKPLPAPGSDFCQLADVPTDQKAVVKKVHTYMEIHVAPIINKHWSDDAFPFEQFETRHLGSASRRARIKPSRRSTGFGTCALRGGPILYGRTFRATWQPHQRSAHGAGARGSCHDRPRLHQQADRADARNLAGDREIARQTDILEAGGRHARGSRVSRRNARAAVIFEAVA